jgi:hypothetical protein
MSVRCFRMKGCPHQPYVSEWRSAHGVLATVIPKVNEDSY